mmetsp:Transcript_1575/g.2760  ORF Transcript_1575/g.2760 Transcript_1575/m.2760 type:complete len:628 (+) Transcript_1575:51-1934(+)
MQDVKQALVSAPQDAHALRVQPAQDVPIKIVHVRQARRRPRQPPLRHEGKNVAKAEQQTHKGLNKPRDNAGSDRRREESGQRKDLNAGIDIGKDPDVCNDSRDAQETYQDEENEDEDSGSLRIYTTEAQNDMQAQASAEYSLQQGSQNEDEDRSIHHKPQDQHHRDQQQQYYQQNQQQKKMEEKTSEIMASMHLTSASLPSSNAANSSDSMSFTNSKISGIEIPKSRSSNYQSSSSPERLSLASAVASLGGSDLALGSFNTSNQFFEGGFESDNFESSMISQEFKDMVDAFEERQVEILQGFLTPRSGRETEINYPPDDAGGRKRYVGSVRYGKPHGKGSLTWTCGNRYYGEFRADKLTGLGVYKWVGGKQYVGEWLDGKACGYGILTSMEPSNMVYRGMWKDGLMHGFGRLQLDGGDWFEGNWRSNSKEGQGVYHWANGDRYGGEFANHQLHGKGTYTWPNGRKLVTIFDRHVPEDAWKLAHLLWLCMTLGSIFYVGIIFLSMVMGNLDIRIDIALHNTMLELIGLPVPTEQALTVLNEETPSWSVAGILRHDLAFPHIRIMLLLLFHSALEEMFANIIANIACAYCHVQILPISDRQAWNQGLFLGCISVLFLSSLQLFLYAMIH